MLLHRRQRAAPHAESLQRAAAAQEFDARSALELLRRRRSRSRRSRRCARRACRRTPTGRSPATSIKRSGPVRADSFRSGIAAASSAVANRIATGRSSQTMRLASSSAFAISDAGHFARQIDRRRELPHVEALGADAEQPIERRRQHVLAGVLLHVIEAPRPVDLAADDLAGLQASPRRRARWCRPRDRSRRSPRRRRACRCRTAGRPMSDRTRSDRA